MVGETLAEQIGYIIGTMVFGLCCVLPLLITVGSSIWSRQRNVSKAAPLGPLQASDEVVTAAAAGTKLTSFQRKLAMQREQAAAKDAYRAARGTHHRQLLEHIDAQLTQKIGAAKTLKTENDRRLQRCRKDRENELSEALQRWIVKTKLDEVPRIGAAKRDLILKTIFTGRLRDLRSAQRLVQGIGQATQAALDAWIERYEAMLPAMMQADFPDKQQIEARYEQQLTNLEREAQKSGAAVASLAKVRAPVEDALIWLKKMDVDRFVTGVRRRDPQVDRYLKGVFGEWEEMPLWMQEAMKVAEAK